MNIKIKNISIVAALVGLLLCVTCTGFFAVSVERQEKRDIARRITSHERQIKPVSYTHLTLPTKRIV